MGIGKIGTTIGKEIIAWTRSGKSLLATSPVKVNTAGLRLAPRAISDRAIESSRLKTDAFSISSLISKEPGIEKLEFFEYLKNLKNGTNFNYTLPAG